MKLVIEIEDGKIVELLQQLVAVVQEEAEEPEPETRTEPEPEPEPEPTGSSEHSFKDIKKITKQAIADHDKDYVADILDYFEVSKEQTLISRRLSALPEGDYDEFVEVLANGIPAVSADEIKEAIKALKPKARKKFMKKHDLADLDDVDELDDEELEELQEALL